MTVDSRYVGGRRRGNSEVADAYGEGVRRLL